MLHNIKRLTKHSAVYGVGHIISRSIGFLLLPLHTNVLPPDIYRNAALLFASLAILNIVFSYGMDVAFLRYFILEKDREKRTRIFSTAFWTIFITGSLFSAFMLIFPEPFSRMIFQGESYPMLIRLASGILLADALALLPFLVLRAEEKSTRFVLLKSLNIGINFGMNVILVVLLKKGVPGIFVSNLTASAITLAILIPVYLQWLRMKFHKEALIDLLKFGLPYVPSGLAVWVMDQIGRFYLDRMVSKEATAIYSAGAKLGMFMALVVAAFRFAWHPFFLSTSKQADAKATFSRILTYYLFVTGFFFLIIAFFIQEIVAFHLFGITLLGASYTTGIVIVPVFMLAYILYGVYANFVVGIYLKKKTVYLPLITGAGAVVTMVVNWMAIPYLGVMGPALATFIAYFVMALLLFLVARQLYPVNYEWGRIGIWTLLVTVWFFLGTKVIGEQSIVFRVLLLAVLPLVMWIMNVFRADEKAAIISRLKRRDNIHE